MSCNRSEAMLRIRRLTSVGALALLLAACAGAPPPPPPPPPPAPVAADSPPAPAAPPATYRVRSGSPRVLEKFPRGTKVTRSTRICLKDGEQVTIAGSNGQQVSYRGPGCMQRTAPPSGANQGGFIFGRNSYGVRIDVEMVP